MVDQYRTYCNSCEARIVLLKAAVNSISGTVLDALAPRARDSHLEARYPLAFGLRDRIKVCIADPG
jgi:hypothetical protein